MIIVVRFKLISATIWSKSAKERSSKQNARGLSTGMSPRSLWQWEKSRNSFKLRCRETWPDSLLMMAQSNRRCLFSSGNEIFLFKPLVYLEEQTLNDCVSLEFSASLLLSDLFFSIFRKVLKCYLTKFHCKFVFSRVLKSAALLCFE